MLWETLNVMRDISRLHDITRVLIRYGGGDVVRLIGIGNILERAGRILHWKEASEINRLEPAVKVRRALEELGPTFVKLGQVLATRVDIFPPNWIAEFEKLQSEVAPVPFDELLPSIEKALGKSSENDAYHIALASVNRLDCLISWNFKHIVNFDKIKMFNSINIRLGYPFIDIRSPLEFLKNET